MTMFKQTWQVPTLYVCSKFRGSATTNKYFPLQPLQVTLVKLCNANEKDWHHKVCMRLWSLTWWEGTNTHDDIP
jgi:hypothetical protein